MSTKNRFFFLMPIGLGLVLFAFQNCAGNNFQPVSGDGVLTSSSLSDPRAGTGEISANGSETDPGSSGNGNNPSSGSENSSSSNGSSGSNSGQNGGLSSNQTTEGTINQPGSGSNGSSSSNNGGSSSSNNNGGSSSSNNGGSSSSNNSGGGGTPTPETICTISNVNIHKRIKVLFVVDVSGSNVQANLGRPASDPKKSFRYNAIKKFLDKFRNRSNFQWQFVTFGGATATSYLKSAVNGKPNFTSNVAEMDGALAQFLKSSDQNNGTPYLKGFDEITKNVTNDPDRTHATDPSNYVVVFLSDGLPTDLNHNSFYGTNWETNAVKLLNLSPGRMTMTAVYYGARDSAPAKNMSDMATRLGGQFVDTNVAGYDFNISDAVNLPELVCR